MACEKCSKCNLEYDDNTNFCKKCGTELEKIENNENNIFGKIGTLAKDRVRNRNKISKTDKKIMIAVFSILFLCAMAGIIFGKKNPNSQIVDDETNEAIEVNENINQKLLVLR